MYSKTQEWIDTILNSQIPDDVIALNFNLYDDGNFNWAMELVGTNNFDLNDDDWACDEVCDFGTRENPFKWRQKGKWEEILNSTMKILNEYLINGKHSDLMKTYTGIGVGFIDGYIEILYNKNKSEI